jgi:methylated-DNA-[protein]-cysteine S-methyltransferase
MGLPTAPRPSIVALATLPGPWGPIHLASTERGLAAVALAGPEEPFREALLKRFGGPVPRSGGVEGETGERAATGHLARAAAALEAVLDADDSPSPEAIAALRAIPIDLSDRPAWDRAVLEAVHAIPRGEVVGYGEVARAVGRPGAARAVGGAVGRNPIGFVIPCHRVVAGDGTLGGYGGGWWGEADLLLDLKAQLLAREGISLPRSPSRSRRGR